MLPIRRFLVSALLLGTLWTPPAWAASPAQAVSGWKTGVMSTADGTFAYCVTEAAYPEGKWVLVALNPAGEVNIGLGQQAVQMQVGERRNVVVTVDGQSRTLPAQVTKPQLLVINTHREPNMLRMIATGHTLAIDGQSFALAGSGAALAELNDCVQVSSARAAAGTPSAFAPESTPPTATAPLPQVQFDDRAVSLPGERGTAPPPGAALPPPVTDATEQPTPPSAAPAMADAPPMAPELIPPSASAATPAPMPALALPAPLMRLLEQAGVEGVRAISPTTPEDSFAWATDNDLVGSVRESNVGAGQTVDALARRTIAILAQDCQSGQFSSTLGTPERTGTTDMIMADSTCRVGKEDVFSAMVFSLSPGGVLSVITHKQVDGERAASRARKGVLKALRVMLQNTQG